MADKVAATYHPNVHTCDRCGSQYTSAIAVMFCCDESAHGEAD